MVVSCVALLGPIATPGAADSVVEGAEIEVPTDASPAADPAPIGDSADSSQGSGGSDEPELSEDRDRSDRSASDPWSPPAPIGVRFAEALDVNEFRVRYAFELQRHQDLLVGKRDRTPAQAAAFFIPYEQAPTDLDVRIHTFELAYAPHSRVTLVVEIPFIQKELRRIEIATLLRNEDETDGIGDVGFFMVVPFIRRGRESSQFHIGLDVPTGSIRRGGDDKRLPYDNQIGNGTVDLEWGLSYQGERDFVSWGGKVFGHHPTGRSGTKWREGSRFDFSAWSALKLLRGISTSLRFAAVKTNNINGFDRSLDLVADGPSSNPKARGGWRIDVAPGWTIDFAELAPKLARQRLAFEFAIPLYQDLDGPQLERQWTLKAGWQWAF